MGAQIPAHIWNYLVTDKYSLSCFFVLRVRWNMDTKELDDFAPAFPLDAPINSHDSSLSTFASHHASLCTLHMAACSCCLGPHDPLSLLGAHMHNRASDKSSLRQNFHLEWNCEEDVECECARVNRMRVCPPAKLYSWEEKKRSANKLSSHL